MKNLKKLFIGQIATFLLLSLVLTNGAFAQSKDEIINGSYFIAFGRFANAREINEWRNGGNYTIAQMVDIHRGHISRNWDDKVAAISRAYMDAFGWNPTNDDINYWAKLNKTYTEVFSAQMNNLRNSSKSKTLVIQQSYYRAFNRLPDAAQLQYWMNQGTYSFAQLVAFHTTWKNQGKNATSIVNIQNKINQNGISTYAFSPQALSAVIAAGGGNVIAAGGGNVVAAGGGNVVAAGGGN